MPSRRDLLEARRFWRRRAVAAWIGGTSVLDGSDDPAARRPGRWLAGAVALAAVATLGVAAHGYLAGGPPKDWLANGNLVVDRTDGGRYLSVHGVLRPVRNLTSLLLLTGGSHPRTVTVSHTDLRSAPVGPPLGIAAAPDAPPPLVPTGTPLIACGTTSGGLDVAVGGRLPETAAQAVLARDPTGGVRLLWHATSYLIDPPALAALGMSADDERLVPTRWLTLFRPGPALHVLRPPTTSRAPRGLPRVVRDDSTGRVAVIDHGRVRTMANRTSLLLLVARPAPVPHATLIGRPQGPAFGYPSAPPTPPPVAGPRAGPTVCFDDTGALSVAVAPTGRPPTVVISPTPVPSSTTTPAPQYVVRQGSAGLLTALPAATGPTASGPAYGLIADGILYPVPGVDQVRALGYDPAAARRLPLPWLRLLPLGPTLVVAPLTG